MSNEKTVNKRLESSKEYMDALQENNAKLCIVRVDLGYKKNDKGNVDITLDEANKDFNRMMNNKRGKPSIFKHQEGQMCLKEYTPNKGVHFHTVFIFDGNKVQKDAHMGDEIGKYWGELTEGRGSYYNCNRQKYKYKGVGMLKHTDTEKREILDEHVISYLCKDDEEQGLTPVKSNNKNRAFVRGTIPKSKGNIGRPRG
ncbi:MAG: hypothetical protein A2540_04740 [Sulfurimonas sp. RIFOXYD2_FULL_37_8]|nr:MAG: hypothetical protein A2540_04740 [Sulfurimonas sp. RIFOXYD2_FULL_37_8]